MTSVYWWICRFWDVLNTFLKNVCLSICVLHKFCGQSIWWTNGQNFIKLKILLNLDINCDWFTCIGLGVYRSTYGTVRLLFHDYRVSYALASMKWNFVKRYIQLQLDIFWCWMWFRYIYSSRSSFYALFFTTSVIAVSQHPWDGVGLNSIFSWIVT